MVEKYSIGIVKKLIKQGVIDISEYEVYCYGVTQIITNVVNTAVIMFVALCLKQVIFTCIFLIAFTSIRQYAGGFHAKTPMRCFCTTMVFSLGAILAAKYYSIWQQYLTIIWGLSGGIICYFAPVQNRNKPLDDIEKKTYRKKTWRIWMLQSSILFICIMYRMHECYVGIVIAQICSAVAICIEMKMYVWRKENEKKNFSISSSGNSISNKCSTSNGSNRIL